jgi:KDO2-lipid IV(A) lauroyltransferase
VLTVILDWIAYCAVRLFTGALNALPLAVRLRLVGGLVSAFFLFSPKHRRFALKNLELAFPQSTPEWRDEVFQQSLHSFARVFVDFARLHTLDEAWVRDHVECPYLGDYMQGKLDNPQQGYIFATGHLGSFEVLAHCVPIFGHPISFVVRSFKLPKLNGWWRAGRERLGNRVIDRDGAFKEALAELGRGRDVGVLFDQNVKRNHAVFVDFFGKPAATTKMVGLLALKTRAPILVCSIRHLGGDRYRIEAVPKDLSAIYSDESLSTDEKVRNITAAISGEYERMIRENPGEWFWMHRRWKTRPEGEQENFYR